MDERCLLLLVSSAALLGTAYSQSGCALPTAAMIDSILDAVIISRSGEGAGVPISLTDFHYTCQAVGDRVGLFRSLSIAVKYNVSVGWSLTSRVRVAQIQFECGGNGMFTSRGGTLEQPVNESLVFSIATRRDCRICSEDMAVANFDAVANCAPCSVTCRGMGQGACSDSSGTDCCPAYGTNGMCTDCPADAITANFTCDVCSAAPCENGGMCITTGNGLTYTCVCNAGFTGTNCTMCTLNCMNGGTLGTSDCTKCMCSTGFTGTECETNIDDCATNPCVNGNCTDKIGGYNCVCDSLWMGTNCDTCLIPNCARCNSNVNPPMCQVCNHGFKLPNCVEVCSPNPCQNGGTCTLQGSEGFTCMCPRGWTGDTCTSCADGFGMLNSECVPCNVTNCRVCDVRIGESLCTFCMPGHELKDGQCIRSGGFPVIAVIGIILGIFLPILQATLLIVTAILLWREKLKQKKASLSDFDRPGADVVDSPMYVDPEELDKEN